jgi:hypothetical protein
MANNPPMVATDPVQYANNQARIAALRVKAEPMYALLADQTMVKEAVAIAKRQKGRRMIKIVLAIDCTDGETVVPMQCSFTQRPIPKPGHKRNGTPIA